MAMARNCPLVDAMRCVRRGTVARFLLLTVLTVKPGLQNLGLEIELGMLP